MPPTGKKKAGKRDVKKKSVTARKAPAKKKSAPAKKVTKKKPTKAPAKKKSAPAKKVTKKKPIKPKPKPKQLGKKGQTSGKPAVGKSTKGASKSKPKAVRQKRYRHVESSSDGETDEEEEEGDAMTISPVETSQGSGTQVNMGFEEPADADDEQDPAGTENGADNEKPGVAMTQQAVAAKRWEATTDDVLPPLADLENVAKVVEFSKTHITLALKHLHKAAGPYAPFARGSKQEEMLEHLTNMIIAGAQLGHRTSHCVWGPPHSGKRRVLRLLADTLKKRKGGGAKFVCMSIDSDMFRQDELGAVWHLIQQIQWDLDSRRLSNKEKQHWDKFFSFLLSSIPNSLLGGTVGARTKSQFLTSASEGRFLWKNNSIKETGDDSDDEIGDAGSDGADVENGVRGERNAAEDDEEDEEAQHQIQLNGGAGLLASLQSLLLHLTEKGYSLVFMIHKIEQFALWNDRLTYVLAGLMHEVENPAGGISLVMTTGSSNVPLEKRLASRLSCEMWHMPPIDLTLTDLVLENLSSAYAELKMQNQVPTVTPAEKLKKEKSKKSGGRKRAVVDPDYRWSIPNSEHFKVVERASMRMRNLQTPADVVQQAAATYLLSQDVYALRQQDLGEGGAGTFVAPVSLEFVLQAKDFELLLTLQSGEVFDHLLGSTALPVGPYRSGPENHRTELIDLPDSLDKDNVVENQSGEGEGGGGEEEDPSEVGRLRIAKQAIHWFPAWKTNCSIEMFLLLWMVYVNESNREERSFHETFLAILSHTSERPEYKLSYQKAQHELIRLRILKLSKKGILGMQVARARVYSFLQTVVADDLIAVSCGIDREKITKVKQLAAL